MKLFIEHTRIDQGTLHGLELGFPIRDQVANVSEVSDLLVLFELGPRKLSHIFSRPFIWNVVCTADNLSPQCQCTLSLDEVVKADWSFPSCSEPGGRLACYCRISSQHSIHTLIGRLDELLFQEDSDRWPDADQENG